MNGVGVPSCSGVARTPMSVGLGRAAAVLLVGLCSVVVSPASLSAQ